MKLIFTHCTFNIWSAPVITVSDSHNTVQVSVQCNVSAKKVFVQLAMSRLTWYECPSSGDKYQKSGTLASCQPLPTTTACSKLQVSHSHFKATALT